MCRPRCQLAPSVAAPWAMSKSLALKLNWPLPASAAVDRDARRDRAVELHAAGEPAEAGRLLDADARDRHRAEHGQRDVGLRDAGVDVACRSRRRLRSSRVRVGLYCASRDGERVEVAVDAHAHFGRRIDGAHGLELAARGDVVARVEVRTRELEPRAHVVGDGEARSARSRACPRPRARGRPPRHRTTGRLARPLRGRCPRTAATLRRE